MAKKQLATSFDANTLDTFRKKCDEYNIKMNTVLETFMNDFNNNKYTVEVNIVKSNDV